MDMVYFDLALTYFLQGSRHKLIYDGMWHLDIPKCQDRDGGKIEVIARNQCGEAYATTTLTVKRRKDDYRSVLRHNVKRKYKLSPTLLPICYGANLIQHKILIAY